MVELARLERVYGATHRGFESLSLRHEKKTRPRFSLLFVVNRDLSLRWYFAMAKSSRVGVLSCL